jgi:hypothetical protein
MLVKGTGGVITGASHLGHVQGQQAVSAYLPMRLLQKIFFSTRELLLPTRSRAHEQASM